MIDATISTVFRLLGVNFLCCSLAFAAIRYCIEIHANYNLNAEMAYIIGGSHDHSALLCSTNEFCIEFHNLSERNRYVPCKASDLMCAI